MIGRRHELGWTRGLLAVVAGAGLLVLSPRPAAAAPRDPARAAAARRVDQGVAAFKAGRYQAALEHFRAGHAAFPSPKILLNVAQALRKLERATEAAQTYQRFLAETEQTPRLDALRAAARGELTALAAEVGTLEVTVTPADAALELDGVPLELAAPGASPVYVTPGAHQLVARAPGLADATAAITVAAGGREAAALMLAAAAPSAPPPPAPIVAAPAPAAPAPAPARRRPWLHAPRLYVLATAGLAVGLAAGGLAAYAGASSSYDEYETTRSPERYDELRDEISGKKTLSAVLFAGAGAAALASGAIYYLTVRRGATEQTSLVVTPGEGGIAVTLGGSY